MSVFSRTYTFVSGLLAKAAEVNQNFDDVTSFLNTNVVHLDGSKVMTGQLTLPSSDPTTNNQAARKAYVDTLAALRLKANGVGSALRGTVTGSPQMLWTAGTSVGPTDGNGNQRINYTTAFPNGTLMVHVTNGDSASVGRALPMVYYPLDDNAGFTAHWVQLNTDANNQALVLSNAPAVRVNYFAIGW